MDHIYRSEGVKETKNELKFTTLLFLSREIQFFVKSSFSLDIKITDLISLYEPNISVLLLHIVVVRSCNRATLQAEFRNNVVLVPVGIIFPR